jgi:hypothetical protein
MFKKFLNTFFFGYLTKFKRLVQGVSSLTILFPLGGFLGEFIQHGSNVDTSPLFFLFPFLLTNSFTSYFLEPFSNNPKNEKWIVLTWAVVMLIFGVIMGQIL